MSVLSTGAMSKRHALNPGQALFLLIIHFALISMQAYALPIPGSQGAKSESSPEFSPHMSTEFPSESREIFSHTQAEFAISSKSAFAIKEISSEANTEFLWHTAHTALASSFLPTNIFKVENDQFVRNGVPVRIISGELHYFRIPSMYWVDRLARTKALGFNAIQTVVPWNYHETERGVLDFEGEKDLVEFLNLAWSMDMMVLLRPGPYICAEWDAGGFPVWLLGIEGVKLRT